MSLEIYTCSKCVDQNSGFTKYGKTKNGKQRYQCRSCKTVSVLKYTYRAYKANLNDKIIQLTKEGIGIRSTARILKISTTTLLKRILEIAKKISPPKVKKYQSYEVDEMRTFIKNKKNHYWLVYALNKNTKEVVSFHIGKRNYTTLSNAINTIHDTAIRIYTDSLIHYRYLINADIHITKKHGTNTIERKNLSIRTHIKSLFRKTICFSRSLIVFNAVMKIYFWQ